MQSDRAGILNVRDLFPPDFALLGGLGSVPGAVAGAVIIGFLEAVIGAVPMLGQRYVLFGTFLFIIAVLIIRPRGIGGLLDKARK